MKSQNDTTTGCGRCYHHDLSEYSTVMGNQQEVHSSSFTGFKSSLAASSPFCGTLLNIFIGGVYVEENSYRNKNCECVCVRYIQWQTNDRSYRHPTVNAGLCLLSGRIMESLGGCLWLLFFLSPTDKNPSTKKANCYTAPVAWQVETQCAPLYAPPSKYKEPELISKSQAQKSSKLRISHQ